MIRRPSHRSQVALDSSPPPRAAMAPAGLRLPGQVLPAQGPGQGPGWRRLTLFVLAAALIGGGVGAGCRGGGGRSAAQGGSPDGSPILARVGDYVITSKQVENRIRQSQGQATVEGALASPDMVQVALNAVMDQMVWGAAAKAAGYGDDPSIKRDVELYEAQEMAKKYLVDTVDKEAEPTEQEIQDFYRENQEHYIRPIRVACRHIRVSTRARAEQLLAQLRGGADFQALARQFSEDTATRDLGGAMGYVSREEGALGIGKDPLFLDAVLTLSKGQLSDVIQSSSAFHLVLCEDKDGGDPLTLDDVRDDVIRRFKPRKFAEVYNEVLLRKRKEFNAEILEANFNEYLGIKDSADRLWEMIGKSTDARGKVETARRLSFDFPRHPLADDAQLLMAYTQLVELKDKRAARKALIGLVGRFPKSELMGAAKWLQAHIDDEELPVKSFEELKTRK